MTDQATAWRTTRGDADDGPGIAPTTLFRRTGWMPPETAERSLGVLDAIESDERLNRAQKAALISTHKAMADGP